MVEKLLIATKNEGKAREYRSLFEPKGFEVITLNDIPEKIEIEENGTTFVENATIKAKALADKYQVLALADDSGLAIDQLNGEPGIYSARYAGDHDDEANKQKVLTKLEGVPREKRTAHFHCAIVVCDPNKPKLVAQGQVDGVILTAPQGEGGFGYDPLFYYPPFEKSFAQLTMEQKNSVSHRGRAVNELMEQFDQWWK
ncbi:HAM1 protein [Ligilactobacillus apodemi DSM 16634 = JCM 16172]|uniref:dITP/XTP pyrophosphatase n=1 Tax=Ligilactobacillus apodemi DSM 16634 = JCM 16172 TaxID=1423724 RepID=A0A0R1U024_9LACO|nr:HAM1 protein [Ligilactobacillus apodemi DSM 16634 = JCM 16172]